VLTSEWEVRNPTRRVVVVADVVSWSQPTAAVPRLELTPFWDRWHPSGAADLRWPWTGDAPAAGASGSP
jgi:hypothetical protein